MLFEREKLAGLSPASYLASKALFLGGLITAQAVWMALFVHAVCRFPGDMAGQVGLLWLADNFLGKDVPFLDPAGEILSWDGKHWNVNNNRLFSTRFEKYLNAEAETTDAHTRYRALVKTIIDKLSPTTCRRVRWMRRSGCCRKPRLSRRTPISATRWLPASTAFGRRAARTADSCRPTTPWKRSGVPPNAAPR